MSNAHIISNMTAMLIRLDNNFYCSGMDFRLNDFWNKESYGGHGL